MEYMKILEIVRQISWFKLKKKRSLEEFKVRRKCLGAKRLEKVTEKENTLGILFKR